MKELPVEPGAPDIKAPWLLPSTLVLMLGANLGITFWPDYSILIAIASTLCLLTMAYLAGHTNRSLGLHLSKRSIIWAAVIGVTVWLGWVLIAWAAVRLNLVDQLTQDNRVTGIDFNALMFSLLVTIPVGTVMLEEIGFRGVLMGEAHRLLHGKVKHPVLLAGLFVSLLFGLWHIGPSIAQANATGLTGWEVVGLIIVTVLFTAASGGLFAWLRHHTQSLIAPAILHAAVNAGGLLLVWALAHYFYG